MSAELYELLSLSARYLFILLGALIVLRAFFWLLSDHWDRRRRLKSLPYAGMIGEFLVCAGKDVPIGTVIPVPWEGILGRLRSCDVILPDSGVSNNHLSFFLEPGSGLVLRPFSGCEAFLNGQKIHCRTAESESIMKQESILQVGSVLLQLRLFSGLRPVENPSNVKVVPSFQPEVPSTSTGTPRSAAYGEAESSLSPALNAESPIIQPDAFFSEFPTPANPQTHVESLSESDTLLIYNNPPAVFSANYSGRNPDPAFNQTVPDSESISTTDVKNMLHRRSKRWEDDWSD